MAKIFEEVDTDGSGVIEVNEFITFISRQIVNFMFITARYWKY